MYILVCGSIGSYGNVVYDYEAFITCVERVQDCISNVLDIGKEDHILLFAGSPCSDCISLEVSRRMNIPVEYHLPCDGNPGEKILKEYSNIPDIQVPRVSSLIVQRYREDINNHL